MTEEWGPWIEHDGKGCPCVGMMVEVVRRYISGDEDAAIGIAYLPAQSWDWGNAPKWARILRYRIRKPKGMSVLEGILKDVEDEKVKEIVG